jgi:hypothetical protein
VPPPSFDEELGFVERRELLSGKQLVAELGPDVEGGLFES